MDDHNSLNVIFKKNNGQTESLMQCALHFMADFSLLEKFFHVKNLSLKALNCRVIYLELCFSNKKFSNPPLACDPISIN